MIGRYRVRAPGAGVRNRRKIQNYRGGVSSRQAKHGKSIEILSINLAKPIASNY